MNICCNFHFSSHIQQQYEFIHCGLSELVVCGETEVAVANLRITVKNLQKEGDDGMTGFQQQMKVIHHLYETLFCMAIPSPQIIEEVSSHHPVTFTDAEQEYNSSKNRFPDKLPSECYIILLPAQ